MSELMIKWNNLLEKKAKLSEEEDALKKEIKEAGLILKGSELIENEETFGLYWSMVYCSRYVGEHGMYVDKSIGAVEISSEIYEKMKEQLGNINLEENEERIVDIIIKEIPLDEYIFESLLSKGNVTFKEDSARWTTTEEGTNGGQMSPGSYFEIKKTTLSEIHAVDNVFEEDVRQ